MKFKNVGSSHRTPLKHYILDLIAGRTTGIISNDKARYKTPCIAKEILFIDICAGDGVSQKNDESSPKIILRHFNYAKGMGVKTNLILIEKSPHTFELLKNNIKDHLKFNNDNIYPLNMDARDLKFKHIKKKFKPNLYTSIIINCDPNHVDELPMTNELIMPLKFYDCTSLIITLGCNVGGLKRKSQEERDKWFEYTELLLNILPKHHDFLLARIQNDSAQWAYLVSTPFAWSIKTADSIRKQSLEAFNLKSDVFSFKRESANFYKCCFELFQTKKEMGYK